jgi:protein KRI1
VTALQELDLDGEWDPDLHDQQMAGIYGEDDDGLDEEKPHWEDDIDIGDIATLDDLNSKAVKKKKKKVSEDGVEDGMDVDAMDADVVPVEDDEEWDGTEEMRKRKLNQYMDEIYGLEFNDIVRIPPRSS